jgi:hypothetical protein
MILDNWFNIQYNKHFPHDFLTPIAMKHRGGLGFKDFGFLGLGKTIIT